VKKILQIFEDKSGKLSSTRFLCALVVTNVLFNWTFVVFKTGELVPFDSTHITLVLGAITGKVLQQKGERNG